MKVEQLQLFKQQIEKEPIPPLTLILGTDDYERKEAADHLINQCLKNFPADYIPQKYDARKLDISLILEELHSLGLFSTKKMIILSRAENLTSSALKRLEEAIPTLTTDTYLIISMEKMNRSSKFYKLAVKHGLVLDLADEKPWIKEKSLMLKANEWLKNTGKTIDPQACQILVKTSGNNHGLLIRELEKLICFIDNRNKIELSDVQAISPGAQSENIFQLGDAIISKNPKTALNIGYQLLDQGEVLYSLLRNIRSYMQTRYHVCSLLTSGATHGDIQKQFAYMRGRILDETITSSQNYGLKKFRQAMIEIDQTELITKSSYLPPELLLEKLIIKLAT